MKGKHHTDESKYKSSESNSGQKRSLKTRKNISIAHKKCWENKEYRENFFKKVLFTSGPNKKELWLENYLNELYPGEWKFVGNGQVLIAGKCPDFINVNGQKKIIEFWGDYWHRGENSQDRADIFKPFGYDILIIRQSELKNIEKLKNKICFFHQAH